LEPGAKDAGLLLLIVLEIPLDRWRGALGRDGLRSELHATPFAGPAFRIFNMGDEVCSAALEDLQ